MGDGLKILGIGDDRAFQAQVAQAFNHAGLFYRFVTDRKKVLSGARQLKPELLMVHGDVDAEIVGVVLEQLSADVTLSTLPIILFTDDTTDAPFVAGLRTGVVGLLKLPFNAGAHLSEVKQLLAELGLRRGAVSGAGPSTVLARLVEHLRKTRRSGLLTFDARTPKEGTATFTHGRIESAAYKNLTGVEALVAMVAQPQAQWAFTEIGGGSGDGAGVVIEVAEHADDGRDEVVMGVAIEESLPAGDEPLEAFEMPVAAKAPPPSAPAPLPATRQTPARLLLVDDDEGLCRMFSTLFTKHGFQVTTAADGVEGYDKAVLGDYDVVIADLNMPRLDGWGMMRQLRDDYRTRELPVAFLSCHDDYREQLKAQNAGAQAYFTKGTRLDPLVAQVRKLMTPRENAHKHLQANEAFSVNIAAVGPQWLLRELALARATGRLDAKDGWASYQLFFTEGAVVHAAAQAGRYTAEAERAFNAFIASRAAEGRFEPGTFPSPQSLALPTDVLIERGTGTLNENERRVREGLLVSASQIDVNEELYAVYRQVGPSQWLEAARLMCEQKVPPREVIAQLDASPIDVEETLKDLIRRGVVSLRKA